MDCLRVDQVRIEASVRDGSTLVRMRSGTGAHVMYIIHEVKGEFTVHERLVRKLNLDSDY